MPEILYHAGDGGMAGEALSGLAQQEDHNDQEPCGRCRGGDKAGDSQPGADQHRIGAQGNPVDPPPGERQQGCGHQRAGHVDRAPFRVAEAKFGLDGGPEDADEMGLPEAGPEGHQQPERQKPAVFHREPDIARRCDRIGQILYPVSGLRHGGCLRGIDYSGKSGTRHVCSAGGGHYWLACPQEHVPVNLVRSNHAKYALIQRQHCFRTQ